MRIRTFAVAVAFAVAGASVPASAATWYVAPTGSDSNAGTATSPFKTITKASTVARAGDTVYARGGVYNDIVKIASRGTSAAPITFRSYPGELAVIDGTGTTAATNLVQLNGTEWVEFSGFEVRNATRIGVCAWGAKNTKITNNRIHGSTKGGIFAGYGTSGSSYDLTISGNEVFNNVLENQYHASTGGWSQAIGIQRTDRAKILKNRVYANDGEGIAFVLSDGGLAQSNEVFDNFSVNIYLDNAQSTTVDANFVYSTGNTRYYRSGHPAHGIGTANETYTDTNPLDGLRITNNIVLRSRWGFFYGNYENGGGLRNSLVANNTFYDATVAVLAIDAATHTGTTIQNNVFYQATGMTLASVAGSGITYRTNSWYGGTAGAAAGSGDIAGNPQLVNAGGRTAADYKLASSSPVIDRGTATSAVTTDYFAQARSGAFDIGAHEFGGSTASTPTTSEPAPAPTKPRKRATR